MMNRLKLSMLAMVVLCLVSFGRGLPQVEASGVTCWVYNVTVTASTSEWSGVGWTVWRTYRPVVGQMVVRWGSYTLTRKPFDLVLQAANNGVTGQPGGLWFMTNTAFATAPGISSQRFDLAATSYNSSTRVGSIVLDEIQNGGLGTSSFLIPQMGLGVGVKSIRRGNMQFSFNNTFRTISGSMSFIGTDTFEPLIGLSNRQQWYSGRFTGTFVRSYGC
jgi:hypothetical protein